MTFHAPKYSPRQTFLFTLNCICELSHSRHRMHLKDREFLEDLLYIRAPRVPARAFMGHGRSGSHLDSKWSLIRNCPAMTFGTVCKLSFTLHCTRSQSLLYRVWGINWCRAGAVVALFDAKSVKGSGSLHGQFDQHRANYRHVRAAFPTPGGRGNEDLAWH
jgi:hypothetical protein